MEILRATIYLLLKSLLMFFSLQCLAFGIFILPVFLFGVSPLELMTSHYFRHLIPTNYFSHLIMRFGLVENPDFYDWIYMYWRFLVNSWEGDFGISLVSARPVSTEIAIRLPNTLFLMTSSTLISTILIKHQLRSKFSQMQLLTQMHSYFQNIIGAAVIVEVVFNWYGIGRFLFDSISNLDYPAIVGSFISLSAVTVIVWFISSTIDVILKTNNGTKE